MSQTLLMILAITLVSLFALQQQRSIVEGELNMIRSELAMMATGVTVDVLEQIGSVAFDENTAGDKDLSAASSLTPESAFGLYDLPNNDVDDFHGFSSVALRSTGEDTLRFHVEVNISYADEADPSVEVDFPTRFKKATARVYAMDLSAPDTIQVWQTYTCGSKCQW